MALAISSARGRVESTIGWSAWFAGRFSPAITRAKIARLRDGKGLSVTSTFSAQCQNFEFGIVSDLIVLAPGRFQMRILARA